MSKLPQSLKRFFWDVDFEKLDPQKHPQYVIERILDLGDEKAAQWMFEEFSRDEIIEAVCNSRAISKKTAHFWSLILDIPQNKIRCLQTDFQKLHRAIWPH